MNEDLGMHIRYVTTYAGAGAKAAYDMDKQVRESVATTARAWDASTRQVQAAAATQVTAMKAVERTAAETAAANVASAVKQQASWAALANEYRLVAAAAEAGSVKQVAAARLASEASGKAATDAARNYGRMREYGTASFRALSKEVGGFEGAVGSAQRRLGGLQSSMIGALGTAAKYGTYLGVGLAGAIAYVGIKFDSMKQQSLIAFETLLGSAKAGKELLADLYAMAARTPFRFQGITQAAQRLLAMGFAAKDVIPTLRAVGDATSALGAGQDVMDRLILALSQMRNAAHLNAQDMNQLTQAGIGGWGVLARAMGKTVGETRKMAEDGIISSRAAADVILAWMEKRFQGSMERQSHTFAGLVSTIKDMGSQTLGRAMQPTFDWLTKTLDNLINKNGKLTASANEVADAWGVKILAGIKTAVAFVQQHQDQILDFLRDIAKLAAVAAGVIYTIVTAAAKVVDKFGGIGEATKQLMIGFVALRVGFAATMIAMRISAQVAATGIKAALISTGIGAIVVLLGIAAAEIVTHWDTVKKYFMRFADWLEAKFKAIVGFLGGLLAKIPSWLPGMGKFHDWGVQLQAWAKSTGEATGATLGAGISAGVTGAVQAATSGVGAGLAPSPITGTGAFAPTGVAGQAAAGAVKGSRLSYQQLQALWIKAGGNPSQAAVMAAIAMAESSGRTDALNPNGATGDYSVGPWQINYYGNLRASRTRAFGSPEQLLANPLLGARAAVSIAGSQGLSAWTTYSSGAYLKYLWGAQTAGQSAAAKGAAAAADPNAAYNAAVANLRNGTDASVKGASGLVAKHIAALNRTAANIMKVSQSQFKLDHNTEALQADMQRALGVYGTAARYATAHGVPDVAADERARATALRNAVMAQVRAQVKRVRAAATKAATAAIQSTLTSLNVQETNANVMGQQLQDSFGAAGVDPNSAEALGIAQQVQGSIVATLTKVRQGIVAALARARQQGLTSLVRQLTTRLNGITNSIAGATLQMAQYAQQAAAAAMQNALNRAQHVVSMAQGGLTALQIGQQLAQGGSSDYTPGQLRTQAGYITGTVVPGQQGLLSALQGQLATAQAGSNIIVPGLEVGGGDAISRAVRNRTTTMQHIVDQNLVNSILDQMQQVQNDIGQANVQAAQLIAQAAQASKQAALDAAAAVVGHAGHVTNMAQLNYQQLQLRERLAGTFDSSMGDRQAYITQQILPALQGEIDALQQQLGVATAQGETSLAEQIAEAIVAKQNDMLQAQLDAQEQTAAATQTLADQATQGSLGFSLGGESWTDMLLGAGVGT